MSEQPFDGAMEPPDGEKEAAAARRAFHLPSK